MIMQDLPTIFAAHHRQRECSFALGIFLVGLEDKAAREQRIAFAQQRQLISIVGELLFGVAAGEIKTHIQTADTVEPDTTRGEAEYVRGLAQSRGWTNIIAVTSRYHISRAQLILKRCLSGRLQMVAAHESISPATWAYQYVYQSGGYLRAAVHPDC